MQRHLSTGVVVDDYLLVHDLPGVNDSDSWLLRGRSCHHGVVLVRGHVVIRAQAAYSWYMVVHCTAQMG